MASNRVFSVLVALTNTYTTNILNPGSVAGGVNDGDLPAYIVIRHIRVLNKTVGAVTYRLFIGATGANAAGTEFMGYDNSVPANDAIDWYGQRRLDIADFLVGGASANTSLVISIEGEIGLR